MGARPRIIAACFLAVWILVPRASCQTWSEQFNRLLSNLADGALGVKKMQDYIDNQVEDKRQKLDGESLTKEISQDLSDKFNAAKKVVENIKSHYMSVYESLDEEATFHDCCHPASFLTFSYDRRLKGAVNEDSLCYVGVGAKENRVKHFGHGMVNVMKENLRKYRIAKWQHIDTEEGVQHIYPAPARCRVDEHAYDPRFREWYVETATPKPKDVVIVIDNSISMSEIPDRRTLMQIARDAAKTVVDTLNPNDKVAIIAFSDVTSDPATPAGMPSCYSDALAQGTPENKLNLKKLIDKIQKHGGNKYVGALVKAFKLLTKSAAKNSTVNRDLGILFLTDGRAVESPSEILSAIRDYNSRLQNKVIILTFGIGDAIQNENIQLLQDIAMQKGANLSIGPITKGKFTLVKDPDDLRMAMGTYYEFFSHVTASNTTVISAPYFDPFGLGLVTSVCSPLVYRSKLRGVACVDLSLSELLGAAAYFRPSELTYAFIVDNHGRLMTHPLLQKLYDYADEPLFIDFSEIERDRDANHIMESMARGESGNKTFVSQRIISRGDSIHDGVDARGVLSQYFWERIKGTDYSVCVVIGVEDIHIQYVSYKPLTSFHYHRLDLLMPPGACSNFGELSIKESAIKFSTKAFVTPSVYLDAAENKSTVKLYSDMMFGKVPYGTIFRDGVREGVAITEEADRIWTHPSVLRNTSKYSTSKYIATQTGVHRTFLGHPLYTQYDPSVRPWFKKAMSNKGRITLSPPYEDAGGAGIVLTLSKTIFQKGKRPHTSKDPIFGVMGLDFTISRFYTLITDTFPECKDNGTLCFAIDNSGYMIFHRDFVANGEKTPKVKHVHIIEKEPGIAYDLIDKGYMRREACVQFATIRDQYYWRVDIGSRPKVHVKHSSSHLSYEMHNVYESNMFFGKKNWDTSSHRNDCTCNTKRLPSEKYTRCQQTHPSSCECPCSSPTDYDYCQNQFRSNGDGWPACTPDPPPVTKTGLLGKDIAANLSNCFDFKCKDVQSERECDSIIGCAWCIKDRLRRQIKTPYCAYHGQCHQNDAEETSTPDSAFPWAGVGGGIGGGFIIIAIIVVSVIMFRRRQALSRTQNSQTRGIPFTAHYPGSSDQSSSAEQSSGSSADLIQGGLPFHVSFAQPHNPVYESGDGEISYDINPHSAPPSDTSRYNPTPPPPVEQCSRPHTRGAHLYINPRDPVSI